MEASRLGVVEAHFADIVWSHEPIGSGELVKLCRTELDWKKPTTYTVLRKLCQRGIFKNDTNDKTHALLGLYLVDFFLPSLILFAKFLRYNAKTPYYQAMGELIMDFIKTIKANLGLKIDIK